MTPRHAVRSGYVNYRCRWCWLARVPYWRWPLEPGHACAHPSARRPYRRLPSISRRPLR